MRIHRVASEMLTELGASSKLNAEWEFFSLVHDEGRRSAQVFLETHALDLERPLYPGSRRVVAKCLTIIDKIF